MAATLVNMLENAKESMLNEELEMLRKSQLLRIDEVRCWPISMEPLQLVSRRFERKSIILTRILN